MNSQDLAALQLRGLTHAINVLAPAPGLERKTLPPAVDGFLIDLYDYFDRFADINDNGGPNDAMQWQNRINELRGRR